MKVCHHCKRDLPLTEFNRRLKSKDGLQGTCRECNRATSAKHYAGNKDSIIAANRVRKKKYRAACHEYISQYLIDSGCEICGYNEHPAALEFDHLDRLDKVANISLLVASQAAWERILVEIQKCRVLCANCHRVHTADQMGWYLAQSEGKPLVGHTTRTRH